MRASVERLQNLTGKYSLMYLRRAWTRIGIRTEDAETGGDDARSSLNHCLQGKQYRDYAAKFVNSDILQPDEARKLFRVSVSHGHRAISPIDHAHSSRPHK